jgi:hypothetical protein
VTYVPAAVRDTRRAVDTARQFDVRHALLAVTSILAVLTIGLSYGGRISAQAFTSSAQATTAPIDLNAIKDASALLPLLEPIVPNAIERRAAATELYQLIASRRARGETLPNVGSLLDAKVTVDGKPRPLLTREQLTALKPSVIVRSPAQLRSQIVLWGSIYLACVWAVALFWWARAIRGDYLLLSAAHILTALGFAVLLSRQDPLRDTLLFVRYAQGTSLGLLLFGWVSSLNLRKASLVSLSYLPLLGALLLSIILIVFGQGPAGSNAKVNLGPVQPVEAIRLLLALFLAGYFARRWELLRDVRGRERAQLPRARVAQRAACRLRAAGPGRSRGGAAVLLPAEGSRTGALRVVRVPRHVRHRAKPRRPHARRFCDPHRRLLYRL